MISNVYSGNFQQFTELLNENNIPWCAVAGTLLGAIREYNFIKHDEDIDIALPAEYRENVIRLIESSDWKLFAIWRREIGITRHCFKKSESKIDLFFIDSDNNNSYLYSYKRNPLYCIWNIEWRMKFPLIDFNKLVKWRMRDIQIYIPENYEELLSAEYGQDWRIPDSAWDTYNAPTYDSDYREVGIIIPTFLRDGKLKALVKSIENIYDKQWYKIYIADSGYHDLKKEEYYKELRNKGYYVSFLPFNCGLSYARNYLVSQVKEPYLLLVDDDFIITKKSNIGHFIRILNEHPDIGVVGGNLENYPEYHYTLFNDSENHKIYYIRTNTFPINSTRTSDIMPSIKYRYCDIVLNFAMFKKELFNDIQWDNNLKLAEHTDFYLRLKQLKKWKVTYSPDVIAEHQIEKNEKEYINFRSYINSNIGTELLCSKWNIKIENFIVLKEY